MALGMLLAGLEVILVVFKEPLSRARQAQNIEKQIADAKAETMKAREQTHIRQAELTAARTRADAAKAALKLAKDDIADAPKAREILIHEVGEPGILPIFRAQLRKTLPPAAEPNQGLFWSRENFVDVWATNPEAAEKVASRLFASKAGYELGTFRPLEKSPPSPTPASQDAAA